MGRDYGDLLTGLALFGVGLVLFLKWEYLVRAAVTSGDRFWGRLRVPQASEQSRRTAGRIIAQVVGAVWMLGGLAMLFAFVTGHDWPLRYATWRELWPF